MSESIAIKRATVTVKRASASASVLDDGVVIATVSTVEVDRDGDVVQPTGIDVRNYLKNPVIMYGHDYSQLPVGRARRVWADLAGLYAEIEFSPFGEGPALYDLVKAGFLNTWSIGFLPGETEPIKHPDGSRGTRFLTCELLEISAVPVPANASALTSAKSASSDADLSWRWSGSSPRAMTLLNLRKINARARGLLRIAQDECDPSDPAKVAALAAAVGVYTTSCIHMKFFEKGLV